VSLLYIMCQKLRSEYLEITEDTFLDSLNAEALDTTAKAFTDGILAIARSSSKKVSAQMLSENLQSIMDAAANDAMSESTAQQMALIWPLINKLSIHADVAAVERRIEQRFIMLSYITSFNWIEDIFRKATISSTDLWPMRLVQEIKKTVNLSGTKAHPVHFASKVYIPSLRPRTYVYTIPGFRWRTSDELDMVVNNAFYRIVSHWLGFLRQELFRTRAAFALVVGRVFGDVLMLDEVWKGFQEPCSIITGLHHRTSTAVTSAHFDAFTAKLRCHPFATSQHHIAAIDTLFQLRQMWQSGLHELTMTASNSESVKPVTTQLHMEHSQPGDQIAVEEAKMGSFLNYLVMVDRSYDPTFVFPNTSTGNWNRLREIQGDLDYLSPFRDRTPCREHLLKAPSRVLESIRTRSGFYSLIIARVITYRSEAFFASDGYYPNLVAWECFVEKHEGKPQEWFCNRRAYGSACRALSKDNASALWASSALWEPWLAHNPDFTFTELYNFLKQKNHGQRVFPSVGELIAFVIAADITSLHIGPFPTVEETGKIISDIGKGARDCLVYSLGLVPNHATSAEIQTMVESLYGYLDTHLTDEQKACMDLHGLMLEHGLCKYKRVGWDCDEII
jgi:hypothetical protein